MRIPRKLLTEWAELKSSGDAVKIAQIANVSPMTIYRAFAEGTCNDDVFQAIADFYREKKERIDNILQDFKN